MAYEIRLIGGPAHGRVVESKDLPLFYYCHADDHGEVVTAPDDPDKYQRIIYVPSARVVTERWENGLFGVKRKVHYEYEVKTQ